MSTEVGPKYPSTAVSGGGSGDAWFAPSNVISDNGQTAFTGADSGDSEFLIATGFDFSTIPDSANIVGIFIEYEGQWVSFI